MKRSPQLEDGYIRFAHELDAALACADFTKGARIVLREVFSQIFGPAGSKTAKVSPTVLGKTYGADKGYFGRAIRELVGSGALEKIGECEYRFVKDYSLWAKNGAPRLNKKEMELALTATDRALSYKYPSGCNPVNKEQPKQQALIFDPTSEPAAETNGLPGCNPVNDRGAIQSTCNQPEGAIQSTAGVQSGQRVVGNPVNGSHYIERARIEKGEYREKEREAAPAARSLGPEYTEVGELAIRLAEDFNWGPWVSKMGHLGLAAAWVKDVVEKMAGRGDMNMAVGYAILKRYAKQGGTDDQVRNRRSAPVASVPVDNSHRYARPRPEFEFPGEKGDPE